MRYFVIEDQADVSVYKSLDSAVNAVEPIDIPCTRIFDEQGKEYPLSVGRKKIRFLGIFPTSVDMTLTSGEPREAELELKNYLSTYANSVGIHVFQEANLRSLVDLIEANST